jgi:hypothetical protein
VVEEDVVEVVVEEEVVEEDEDLLVDKHFNIFFLFFKLPSSFPFLSFPKTNK